MDKNNWSEKLNEKERQKSEECSRISALVVHEAIRWEEEAELGRALKDLKS